MIVTRHNLGPDFFVDHELEKIVLNPENDTRVKDLTREGNAIVLVLNNGKTLSVSIAQDEGE